MRLSGRVSSAAKNDSSGDSKRCWPLKPGISVETARQTGHKQFQTNRRRTVGRSTVTAAITQKTFPFTKQRCARARQEAPMFPFDVILFDVGGVLLTNGWDHRERATVTEHFQLDAAEFEARHAATFDAWERDAISGKAYLDAVVFNEPRSFSRGAFFSFLLKQSKALPDGALGILGEIAASHEYLLGALNNEARETNEYRFKKFGLRSYFDRSE